MFWKRLFPLRQWFVFVFKNSNLSNAHVFHLTPCDLKLALLLFLSGLVKIMALFGQFKKKWVIHPLACPCSNLHKVCPWLGHPDAHLPPSHIDVCATVQAHPSFQWLCHPGQAWVLETQNCVTFEHERPGVLNHGVGRLRKKRHRSLEKKGISTEINFQEKNRNSLLLNDSPI